MSTELGDVTVHYEIQAKFHTTRYTALTEDENKGQIRMVDYPFNLTHYSTAYISSAAVGLQLEGACCRSGASPFVRRRERVSLVWYNVVRMLDVDLLCSLGRS